MKKYVVVVPSEVLLTDENGTDFRTRKGDTIEIENGEVYWITKKNKRVLTNMRVDYMYDLLLNKNIEPKIERVLPCELSRKGGKWLGAARSWLQSNTMNGDRVTWGSRDIIEPHLTVNDIEDLAAHIAAAAINEIERDK
jgi:hypothetical protein